MPPEGYTTVTLPDELAAELEAISDTNSPAGGVRVLLAQSADRGPEVDHDAIADAVARRDVTLEASERRAIAEEVAEVLGR